MVCLLLAPAAAQESTMLRPILRAKVDPPTTTVGQKTTLTLDVLAPNYMTKPLVLPDFQIRNAATRAGSTVNLSEQLNGTTYAGVRYEFLIYPQEPGSYSLPVQNITVTYAADPPASREAIVATPALSFNAVIPDAAQELDPFIAADRLTVRQEIKPSTEPLKVGDSIVLTVTVEADGTPAMLLPPQLVDRVAEAENYAAQPQLQDEFESRTDALVSQRVDQATYVLQQAGKFVIPAIDIAWWNVRDGKIEHAAADAVVFDIAESPAVQSRGGSSNPLSWRQIVLFIADHWWELMLIIIAGSAAARFGRATTVRLQNRVRRHRDAYRRSEAFAFAKFRAAARQGDPGKAYFGLLNWLECFEPGTPLRTFRAAAHDAELDHEIAAIESRLFGSGSPIEARRSLVHLSRRVSIARRHLRRMAIARRSPLPATLNPGRSRTVACQRPPAR
jgi:hypothetical protein